MKLTLTSLLLLGLSVTHAIAVAEPGRKIGWCGVPGDSCARLKRSADAIIEAFTEPHVKKSGHSLCDIEGEACHEAFGQINKVGQVGEEVYNHAITAREAHKGGKIGWCGAVGDSCAKRDASPEPARGGKLGWCGVVGDSCAKRDASPEPKKGGRIGWCGAVGDSCAKRRDAIDRREAKKGGRIGWCGAVGDSCAKRDASPEPKRGGKIGWCGAPGDSCAKRDASPEPKKGGRIGWCGAVGDACAKRDLEATQNAVRAVKDLNPSLVRSPCFEEGGECAAIHKAHSEFHRIKRESADIKTLSADAKKKYLAFHHGHDDDASHALSLPSHEQKRAEEACYGPDGECTIAERGLDELERALNEAVESLSTV